MFVSNKIIVINSWIKIPSWIIVPTNPSRHFIWYFNIFTQISVNFCSAKCHSLFFFNSTGTCKHLTRAILEDSPCKASSIWSISLRIYGTHFCVPNILFCNHSNWSFYPIIFLMADEVSFKLSSWPYVIPGLLLFSVLKCVHSISMCTYICVLCK